METRSKISLAFTSIFYMLVFICTYFIFKGHMEPASLLNQVDCFAIHALWRNFSHAGFIRKQLIIDTHTE